MKNIVIKIKRQESPQAKPYWQKFTLAYKPGYNVVSALQAIRLNPITSKNKRVTPPVWECNCLEEVCGACSMLINGKPAQACSTLVDNLSQPIKLQPLSKFPVIRDLMVDRSSMFHNLKKIHGWIDIDGAFDLGPGPRIPPQKHQARYKLSTCMSCGCCAESCPQVNPRSSYMGPAPIAQVALFNSHPTGNMAKQLRIDAIMKNDGIANCSNAQNCQKACPKEIPLVTYLSEIQREVTLTGILGKLFR